MSAVDTAIASAMVPILQRGTAALRALFAGVPLENRPIGLSINVVTEADFVAYPKLVLHHVCINALSCHVLCADGTICSLLERLNKKG